MTRPSRDAPICHLIDPGLYGSITEQLTTTLGGSWSFGQVCGYLLENVFGNVEACDPVTDEACRELLESLTSNPMPTPTPPPLPARLAATALSFNTYKGVLIRNACGGKNDKQVLKVTVSFKQRRTAPTTIRLSALELTYQGDMAATIKPVSEGKFAPQPLLLMSYLSTCGQEAFLSKFTNNTERNRTPIKVRDLIPYNGRVLNRSPIGALLRGGKGTFTLTNGDYAYGVCFNLVAKRQKVNGY